MKVEGPNPQPCPVYPGRQRSGWFGRAAAMLRLAGLLRVPVGYEDETGFHCGAPGASRQLARARLGNPV